ncbi:hypothetical protein [Microbacterium kunmingense]|uniref:hypothetical protein n=1 Tax=Microbacterium kunmingense TaxID=2915939 RepID=UPI002003730E|nr:hypothetical protein [Microbacterium kunmingense]
MAELSVDIDVNTGSAVSNVEKLGQSFSDAARELLEIVDAGKRAGKSTEDIARDISKKYDVAFDDAKRGVEKLENALEDVGREGGRAGDKLQDALKDVERRAEDTGDGIKKGIGDGLREAGDEAKQSGREAAASFSGEWTDVGDFIQETVANGLGGFGPLGVAAGIAGAAGIGLVTNEIIKQQEEATRLKEYFADAYKSAAEEGRKYLDTATILAEANSIIFDDDRANEYKEILEESNKLNIDANTLVLARAGDQESLNVVLQATADKEREVKAAAEEAGSTAIRLAGNEVRELEKIQGRYENIGQLHGENAGKLANATGIAAQLHQQERDQINRTADTAAARYDGLARQYGVPLRGKVVMDVDDSAVRNYKPPSIRGTVRLSPGVDQIG